MERKKPPSDIKPAIKPAPIDLSGVPSLVFKKALPPIRKRSIATPEEFDAIIDEYVAKQKAKNAPLTLAGMALALGFAERNSLLYYEKIPEFEASVKRCRLIIEETLEERLIKGHNIAGTIFVLCQPWMGWTNPRYEHRITHEGNVNHTHKKGPDWSKLDDETLEKVAAAALPPPRGSVLENEQSNVIDLKPETVRVSKNGKD